MGHLTSVGNLTTSLLCQFDLLGCNNFYLLGYLLVFYMYGVNLNIILSIRVINGQFHLHTSLLDQ